MAQPKFSLAWGAYPNSISKGLSSLQQNGEFVDMTLAADGYHVKVHQLVISLMSPYIKDLISSANCPHPVIFLNQMSHKTLCVILEYVYTGEMLVDKDDIPAVIQAAKALQIQGLAEMDVDTLLPDNAALSKVDLKLKDTTENITWNSDDDAVEIDEDPFTEEIVEKPETMWHQRKDNKNQTEVIHQQSKASVEMRKPSIQYTVSSRGNLQIIVNRFMYHMRYKGRNNSHRRWQCVERESRSKCQAAVVTWGDTVVKRLGVHTHGFHDKKILQKVSSESVFTAIKDVENKLPDAYKNKHGLCVYNFSFLRCPKLGCLKK